MGVNQGNYYVLGGYGKFFLHRGVFLFTEIAHSEFTENQAMFGGGIYYTSPGINTHFVFFLYAPLSLFVYVVSLVVRHNYLIQNLERPVFAYCCITIIRSSCLQCVVLV